MAAERVAGRRVVVMGLGRFGGGIGVTRWLAEQGARVIVTDKAPAADLQASVNKLTGLDVTFHLGGHDVRDLEDCDLLVVSPAVPKDRSEFVAEAVRRGIQLSSEMNLFLERCPARRVIGITGSAGKSTTTAMIGAILQRGAQAGLWPRAYVGGNIGQSLLADLPSISADDLVVLELSSFQLEDCAAIRWSPLLALITNITPNHLDRHGTLEAYASAKMNIVRFQTPHGRVFVRQGDESLARRVVEAGGGDRVRRFSFDDSYADVLKLPGRHNRDNAAAAVAVARELAVPDALIRDSLAGFRGLPHRLEFVAERAGVRYYNDSKSTTPEAACLALESFDVPVVMMVGGGDKDMPFEMLAQRLVERARGVVCYGETGSAIYRLLKRFQGKETGGPVAVLADTFEAAVDHARRLSIAGGVVVMSPACTSYDMFKNYEQRGDRFKQLVEALPVY